MVKHTQRIRKVKAPVFERQVTGARMMEPHVPQAGQIPLRHLQCFAARIDQMELPYSWGHCSCPPSASTADVGATASVFRQDVPGENRKVLLKNFLAFFEA